jgi:hypothetical protein
MIAVLVVSVDTEEEFDWTRPLSSANRSVRHFSELPRLQEVFDECAVRPTYVVDHPVATTDACVKVLDDIRTRNGCEIGAHLHPWVNPPLKEEVSRHNSYLCNLPVELQQEKLVELTAAVRTAFGVAPVSFKAGRYGLDFALAPSLRMLGYRVDASVRALDDFRSDGGPNFADLGPEPFWVATGAGPLLEVPCTTGFNLRPFDFWARVHRALARMTRGPFRPVGLLWRTRALRRIALTPEGYGLGDLQQLARTAARGGCPVLHLTLHSPSCAAGYTPYVRTPDDRGRFLETLRGALRFIIGELGARPRTLAECADEFKGRSLPVRNP